MTSPQALRGNGNHGRSLLELLELTSLGASTFQARYVFDDPYPLFGGQVVAQALRAAGQTVPADRPPHSLHAYFLRRGSSAEATEFEILPDRDGRSFSNRRVVARQDGREILTLTASFHVGEDIPPVQVIRMPTVAQPIEAEPFVIPRLFSHEGRLVHQEYPHHEIVSRFWARCTEDLGRDPLLNACASAYLSDISTGLATLNTPTHGSMTSVDHAMWFHRPAAANDWVLMDLVPHVVSHGRGWYRGSLFAADGLLLATITQEALYREGPVSYLRFGL